MKMLTKKDVLTALGLMDDIREDEHSFLWGLLAGVGIGAAVGSAVAMMLAPRKGSELRGALGMKAQDFSSNLGMKVKGIVEKAKGVIPGIANGNKGEVGVDEGYRGPTT